MPPNLLSFGTLISANFKVCNLKHTLSLKCTPFPLPQNPPLTFLPIPARFSQSNPQQSSFRAALQLFGFNITPKSYRDLSRASLRCANIVITMHSYVHHRSPSSPPGLSQPHPLKPTHPHASPDRRTAFPSLCALAPEASTFPARTTHTARLDQNYQVLPPIHPTRTR